MSDDGLTRGLKKLRQEREEAERRAKAKQQAKGNKATTQHENQSTNWVSRVLIIIALLMGTCGLQRFLGDSDTVAFYTICPLAILLFLIG